MCFFISHILNLRCFTYLLLLMQLDLFWIATNSKTFEFTHHYIEVIKILSYFFVQ